MVRLREGASLFRSCRSATIHTEYGTEPLVDGHGIYTYDPLYRLIEAEGREHPGQQPTDADMPWATVPHPNDVQAMRRYTETYDYDEVGNITQMAHQAGSSGWIRHYQYDAVSNRLAATSAPTDPSGGPYTHLYTHDDAGNMLAMPHLSSMAWDWGGRLQQADKGGGGLVHFAYDAGGQRVRKVYVHSGVTEERIYLGSYEVFRRHQSGTVHVERQTLHVMDGERRVAMVETKTRDNGATVPAAVPRFRYQHANHLGSAALELDEAGQIISYEEYFPYGMTSFRAAASGVNVGEKRYRYTGMERDEETGLSYHSARYYVTWLGRWASADPIELVDGPNRYQYARSSPNTHSDTSGKQASVPEEKEADGNLSKRGQHLGRVQTPSSRPLPGHSNRTARDAYNFGGRQEKFGHCR